MPEITINGKNVVLKDQFTASVGWGLLPAMSRVGRQRTKLMEEILGRKLAANEEFADDPAVESAMERIVWSELLSVLTFDETVRLIQGAVESWEYDIDFTMPEEFAKLHALHDILPLAQVAYLRFYASKQETEEADLVED